jgi:hemerythrin-like domain-containing protein
MNQSTSILALMVKDHCKIDELIKNLDEKSKLNFEEMEKAFTKLEWELEKHIFTEEKAIFTNYKPEDVSEGYKMLPELTKQHNYIVNILNNWRADVKKKKMLTDVYSLKEFLKKHTEYEEQEVYPRLDEALSDEVKSHIVAKISEII